MKVDRQARAQLATILMLPLLALGSGLPGRDAVVVTPGQQGLVGDADAASQGTIDEEQIEHRPFRDPLADRFVIGMSGLCDLAADVRDGPGGFE